MIAPAFRVDKIRLDTGKYILSMQDVRKRIGGRFVLDGIDIDCARGTLTVLAGPAGSGKTLVLDCIAGIVRPSRGRIRFYGFELRGRTPERIVRMGVARSFAEPQRFGALTVLETLIAAALVRRPSVTRARTYALEILALTGLHDLRDARTAALDAHAGARFEVARAVATDPKLLLLDDVLAGCRDAAERETMLDLLRALLARDLTLVVTTREPALLAPVATRTATIVDGRAQATAGAGS